MIEIKKPFIEISGEETFLKSEIIDSNLSKSYLLWYSVDKEYGRYFSDDIADSFLLAMLQIAMYSHQNIKINCPVSSRLLYNLKNTVMPLLCDIIPNSRVINIECETTNINFEAKAVGCGCSLGVDSFSSILKNIGNDVVEDYRITHLALFNSGQHGESKLKDAECYFKKNVEEIKPFVNELGLKLVAVNSNINTPYLDYDISFLKRFIQMTVSVVYSLPKLFGKYIYASSYPINDFKISSKDVSYSESALVPVLSTNNTEIILSNPMMTRVEKTIFISDSNIVKKYLDVCWAVQFSNSKESSLLIGKTKKNCGKCPKCMRTLLTLEILGKINDYNEIFDLNQYYKHRWKYIVKVISSSKTDIFEREIYKLMKEKNFNVPLKYKVLSLFVRLGIYKALQKLFGYAVMPH